MNATEMYRAQQIAAEWRKRGIDALRADVKHWNHVVCEWSRAGVAQSTKWRRDVCINLLDSARALAIMEGVEQDGIERRAQEILGLFSEEDEKEKST